MCTVSMIGDHYRDKYPIQPWVLPDSDSVLPNRETFIERTNEELLKELKKLSVDLSELKKDMEEMKILLRRAVKYDKDNNQEACEMEEKVALLKRLAELSGVDLSDVFPVDAASDS